MPAAAAAEWRCRRVRAPGADRRTAKPFAVQTVHTGAPSSQSLLEKFGCMEVCMGIYQIAEYERRQFRL